MSRHDRLPVGMPERRVVDHDVLGGDALGLEVGLEDLVRRARIDVVGAREHPALDAFLVHQVVDRRDRLLVRRGAGVEDVPLALLALVLDRVEQDRVQLLEHRQHRLAADAGPAAEDHVDLLPGDQFARLLGEERPVRRRVDHHRPRAACRAAPPLAFCSSISISMTSFSVVSEIAIVPESECRMPTLIVSSCASAAPANRVPASARSNPQLLKVFAHSSLCPVRSVAELPGGRPPDASPAGARTVPDVAHRRSGTSCDRRDGGQGHSPTI